MINYLLFFYLIYFFSFFENSKKIIFFKWISNIIIVLFIGYRNKIGVDWWNYENFFYNFESVNYLINGFFKKYLQTYNHMEIGFKILVTFLQSIGLNYVYLQVIISILMIVSINKFTKKDILLKKNYFSFLSLFLIHYLFLDIDLLRQSISFYIFLYSFDFLFLKNNRKFIIFNIIGSFFHFSGFINLLLCLFLKKIRIKTYSIVIILLIYISSKMINISNIYSFLAEKFILSNINILSKIGLYLKNSSPNNINNLFFLNIILILYILYSLNFLEKGKDLKKIMIIKLFLLFIILESFFGNYRVGLERFNYYYQFTIPYLIIMVVNSLKVEYFFKKIIIIFCVGIYLSLRIFIFSKSLEARMVYLPYSNYLFKTDEEDKFLINKRELIEIKD